MIFECRNEARSDVAETPNYASYCLDLEIFVRIKTVGKKHMLFARTTSVV